MTAFTDPFAESPQKPQPSPPDLLRTILALAWTIVVAAGGGYVCGLFISRFEELGSASLYALGWLAGNVGHRIYGGKSIIIGWAHVIACVVAALFAEVCWMHWNTIAGKVSWQDAFGLLPSFFEEYSRTALIAGVFTAFGAFSAFRQTAKRYRIVHVVEE